MFSEADKKYINNESRRFFNLVALTRWKDKDEFYCEFSCFANSHKIPQNRVPIVGYKMSKF